MSREVALEQIRNIGIIATAEGYPAEAVGPFTLARYLPIILETQQTVQGPIRQLRDLPQPPALQRSGETQGAKRVPYVVLGVTEGPFSVFPGLPPEDAGEDNSETVSFPQPVADFHIECLADLETVQKRIIVGDTGGQVARLQQQQITLGGMQIAAGGIDAQGPAHVAGL